MKNLKKYMNLYRILTVQYLKTLMEYRSDFIVGLLAFISSQVVSILTIKIILREIPSLNGWSYSQILFIYAMSQIPRGLDHLLTDNLWLLSNHIIVQSKFDKYLLKPINPLFYLLAEKFQTDALGEIIIGFGILVYSIIDLEISVTPFLVIIFFVFIFCGTMIYTGIKLIFSSLAFWFKTSDGILGIIYSISDFVRYPLDIYPDFVKCILSSVIPFAFTSYYPAAFFLKKDTIFICILGAILCAILIIFVALRVWNAGIRVYEGDGN